MPIRLRVIVTEVEPSALNARLLVPTPKALLLVLQGFSRRNVIASPTASRKSILRARWPRARSYSNPIYRRHMDSPKQSDGPATSGRTARLIFALLFVAFTVNFFIRKAEISKVDEVRRHLLKGWNDNASTSIADVVELNAYFQHLQFNVKEELKPQQLQSLRNQLVSTFIAYSSGSFSNYLFYRYPSKRYTFENGVEEQIVAILKSFRPDIQASELTERGVNLVGRLWAASNEKTNLYCTKCWDRFDGKNTIVSIDVNVATHKKLKEIVRGERNLGVITFKPMATSSPTAEEILTRDGKLVTATLSTIINMKGDLAYPVYIQYYLVPEANWWIPSQLATAYSGDRNFDLIF